MTQSQITQNHSNNMRNNITLTGLLSVDSTLRMSRSGKPYRNGTITVERTSGTPDKIHLVIPAAINVDTLHNQWVTVSGIIAASRREGAPRHQKLAIYVKVNSIRLEPEDELPYNMFTLTATMATPVALRHTPLGKLIGEIKVTLRHNVTLPCILWNNVALALSHSPAGTKVTLTGRLQSRAFQYINDDQSIGNATTTELCVQKFDIIDNDDDATALAAEEQDDDNC